MTHEWRREWAPHNVPAAYRMVWPRMAGDPLAQGPIRAYSLVMAFEGSTHRACTRRAECRSPGVASSRSRSWSPRQRAPAVPRGMPLPSRGRAVCASQRRSEANSRSGSPRAVMLPVVGWPGGCCAARCSAETGADSPTSTATRTNMSFRWRSSGRPGSCGARPMPHRPRLRRRPGRT